MPIITITPPAVEPVSVAEVKDSARADGTELDAQIAILIPAFRQQAEHMLSRKLISQTVELVVDRFPWEDVDLLFPDVQSIVSVKYLDSAGTQQTLVGTSYYLDSDSTPCWLIPASSWPTVGDYANAVRIRYVVGYGDAAINVPACIITWITAHVCQALDNPSGIDTSNIASLPYLDRLLDSEKVWRA